MPRQLTPEEFKTLARFDPIVKEMLDNSIRPTRENYLKLAWPDPETDYEYHAEWGERDAGTISSGLRRLSGDGSPDQEGPRGLSQAAGSTELQAAAVAESITSDAEGSSGVLDRVGEEGAAVLDTLGVDADSGQPGLTYATEEDLQRIEVSDDPNFYLEFRDKSGWATYEVATDLDLEGWARRGDPCELDSSQ